MLFISISYFTLESYDIICILLSRVLGFIVLNQSFHHYEFSLAYYWKLEQNIFLCWMHETLHWIFLQKMWRMSMTFCIFEQTQCWMYSFFAQREILLNVDFDLKKINVFAFLKVRESLIKYFDIGIRIRHHTWKQLSSNIEPKWSKRKI